MALLVLLQFVITWLSVRSPGFRNLVKSEPTLIMHQGEFLDGAMRAQRITQDEVMAALRSNGVMDASQAAAVVLETDGSITVIKGTEQEAAKPTLAAVRKPYGWPPDRE
jgi:uncharacterized membrane protein YcaP (DUF421 family)